MLTLYYYRNSAVQWSVQASNNCDWNEPQDANTNDNTSSFLVYWWPM